MSELARKHAEKIYERIRYYVNNGLDCPELDAAWNVFSNLLKKLNLTEEDFQDKVENTGGKVTVTEYTPNLSTKRNPKWFEAMCNLASVHFECRIASFTDRLGVAIYGDNGKDLTRELDYLIERSKHTYKVICAFITGNKPRHEDYMLGFAFGYDARMHEAKLTGEASVTEEDMKSLAVISTAFVIIDRHLANLKEESNGEVKDREGEINIKDQNAFILGRHDGYHAKIMLFKK